MMKVLIVGNDRTAVNIVVSTLQHDGYHVIQARDGESAIQRWSDDRPDLIVLDVNLPRLESFTVCQRIREQDSTPIMLLAAEDEEDDIIHGLGLGADDYVIKPVIPGHLLARVQVVLRVHHRDTAPRGRRVGDLALDLNGRKVRIGQHNEVLLTPLECRLLEYLMIHAGRIVACEAIVNHIWGFSDDRRDMLRQLMRRLRKKIATACSSGPFAVNDATMDCTVHIENVPGLGYGLSISSAPD
jgi:DNA-binding response OmpR family regulator